MFQTISIGKQCQFEFRELVLWVSPYRFSPIRNMIRNCDQDRKRGIENMFSFRDGPLFIQNEMKSIFNLYVKVRGL